MAKLLRNFLIAKPQKGAVVMVHSNPRKPYKAVLLYHNTVNLDEIWVKRLMDGGIFSVRFAECTHANV